MPLTHWLGVDTGGTFTDFVLLGDGEPRIHKVLSTPSAPEQAILQGISELGLTSAMADGALARSAGRRSGGGVVARRSPGGEGRLLPFTLGH